MAKPILCYLACPICGARVALHVDTAGKVYGRCTGDHDGKACGSSWRYGATHSDNLKRQAEAAAAAPPVEKTDDGRTGPDSAEPYATGRRSPFALL